MPPAITEAEKQAAAAKEAAAKKPTTTIPKEMRDRLLKGDNVPTETPEQKAKREADAKAAADAAAADEAKKKAAVGTATPPVEEPAKKLTKKPKSDLPPIPPIVPAAPPTITEEVVRQIVAEQPRGATATVAPTLSPDDQSALELAEFAARQHADQYADLPKKLAEFFPARDAFLAEKAKELGGRESAEFRDFVNGSEFKQWVNQHAPTYRRGDSKKIYEEYIEDRGAKRALEKVKPELEEIKLRQRQIEQTPIIQQTVNTGVSMMLSDTDQKPDEALVEFAKNPADFVKANEVEGGIIVRNASFFKDAMEETLRITSGLVDLTKGQPTKTQQWIEGFVTRKEGELESKFPNGAQMPDGKILVSTAQFARLRAARVANLNQYRMMQPGEIVGAMAVEGRLEIKRELAAERERLERAGYRKATKAPETPQNGVVHPNLAPANSSPMAGSSAARGAGGGSAAAKPEKWFAKYIKG